MRDYVPIVVSNVECDLQALNLGIIGPCLLDLEGLIGLSSSGQLSIVFTVRGLLAICASLTLGGSECVARWSECDASLTLGPVLDRVNHYLLVSVALLVDFVMYVSVSQCRSLTTLLLTLGPPEFVNCGIGMG